MLTSFDLQKPIAVRTGESISTLGIGQDSLIEPLRIGLERPSLKVSVVIDMMDIQDASIAVVAAKASTPKATKYI